MTKEVLEYIDALERVEEARLEYELYINNFPSKLVDKKRQELDFACDKFELALRFLLGLPINN